MERQAPVDIISNIPEEIQMQIVSRLPRKDVIKTGVLSTAWNALWINWKNRFQYPTELEFNPPYWGEELQGSRVKAEIERLQAYKNENKKIEKYELDFNPGDEYEKSLMRIIRTSILCGVEELKLDFSQGFRSLYVNGGKLGFRRKKPELKEKNFEGNSIAYLSLAYCRIDRNFRFKKFPYVQFLNFFGVNVTESMLEHVLKNCNALETLVLTECFQLKNVRIGFPIFQLRNLIIEKCPGIDRIHLVAPNLRKFHFFGYLPERITIFGARLQDVIWISSQEMNYYRANNFWPTFATRSRIQRLSMCNVGMQHLFEPQRLSVLQNLRVISFRMLQFWDNEIMDFFRLFNQYNLPLLQSLIIEFPSSDNNSAAVQQQNNVMIWEVPPLLNFQNLFSIKMTNFDGRVQQLTLLIFFLSRAANLLFAQLVLPPNFDMDNSFYSLSTMVGQIGITSRVDDAEIMIESTDGRYCMVP